MNSSKSITELAAIIAENTAIVDKYFSSHNLPTPSFEIDGPLRVDIPSTEKEATAAHATVVTATQDLHDLMLGPATTLMGVTANDMVSLHAIYKYKIASAFPVGSEVSFEEISEKCGLNIIDLKRLLRYAMTNHIFQEPRPGVVVHTAASRLLAENTLVHDFVGISCEERLPVDALVKYGYAQDPAQSGFSLGHGTDKGLYDELQAHPDRGRRWAGAMSIFASRLSIDPLAGGFAWAALGEATVVDVGGGWGPVSVGLAQRFPELRLVVQDLPDVVKEGPAHVPAELSRFMSYDILTEQPVKGAAIYFFRAVYHNWPDAYCIKILRNQIPALTSKLRLVINDTCLHEPGTLPPMLERRRRAMDINMLTYFGSRERTVEEWKDMLKEADERFELKSAVKPPADMNYILEVIWKG